jgi:hypothetical protein
MMKFEIVYRRTSKIVTVWHRWDLKEKDIVTFRQIREKPDEDYVGKFVEFEDGSGWHAQIRYNKMIYVKTNAGMFITTDYKVVSNIKYPETQYSGLYKREEGKHLRSYTSAERFVADGIIRRTIKPKRLLPRIKRLIMDKLKTMLEDEGITSEWVFKKMKELVDSKGTIGDKHKVLIDLLKINEPAVAGLLSGHGGDNKKIPVFNQFNQFNINERKRQEGLPDAKNLNEIIGTVFEVIDDKNMGIPEDTL